MNDKLTNNLNMVNSTIGYTDANPTPTAGIVAFGNAVTGVKSKLVLINGLIQIGNGSTTGVTTDTNVLRKVMTQIAVRCAKGTLAYANSVNNNTLKAIVNFTEDKLDKKKREEVDDFCQAIHDAANANIATVVNFGVTATDLSDLQTAITLFRSKTPDPRNAQISITQAKKQATAMVKDIIKNSFVGQMDPMVDALKPINLNYWNGYKQAREVIDLGSSSAKVRGSVKDNLTAPLKDVVFRIFETGTQTLVKQVKTDAKGLYSASQLPSGDYDFEWTLAGYKTVTETGVHIGPGKDLRRKIVMKAIVVREGDLGPGMFTNIDTSGLDGTNVALVTAEATGSGMRFYATASPGNGNGGGGLDVGNGNSTSKATAAFETAVGYSPSNNYLNVQNMGGQNGHWKLVFELI